MTNSCLQRGRIVPFSGRIDSVTNGDYGCHSVTRSRTAGCPLADDPSFGRAIPGGRGHSDATGPTVARQCWYSQIHRQNHRCLPLNPCCWSSLWHRSSGHQCSKPEQTVPWQVRSEVNCDSWHTDRDLLAASSQFVWSVDAARLERRWSRRLTSQRRPHQADSLMIDNSRSRE